MHLVTQWYLWGIVGGLALPWLIWGKAIKAGFEQRGAQGGVGVWSGMCWFTVPFMLAVMYGVHLATGK